MDTRRVFHKKSMQFIISASKSKSILSAFNFFHKNFNLKDIAKDSYDEYRDFWVSILMDNLNSLPPGRKELISISIVEPQTSGRGFILAGSKLRYDIIAFQTPGVILPPF